MCSHVYRVFYIIRFFVIIRIWLRRIVRIVKMFLIFVRYVTTPTYQVIAASGKEVVLG
jgi:hypothetical protein